MKILIIGSGGREHAIGWKIFTDSKTSGREVELHFAPGNAGTAQIGKNIVSEDLNELADWAFAEGIEFTIVGPEAELSEGVVDVFESKSLRIFGPNKKCAQLESSKAFAKDFMKKYGVQTGDYQIFHHSDEAREYLQEEANFPIVVKASGLAAGKGVLICENLEASLAAVDQIMEEKSFGNAGEEIVIEEFLDGFEASILSVFNGKEIVSFLSAMDHKKIGEGDTGLNTGGMGVLAPNPKFTQEHWKMYEEDILQPTLHGLLEEKLCFSGVIFFGLMIVKGKVYLLEYNLRMGDPETQATLPLLKSDLLDVFMKAEQGDSFSLEWEKANSCCVVMASGGYPLNYEKGFEIRGLENMKTPSFISGAIEKEGKFLTSGGRVLSVVGVGSDAKEARKNAYENVEKIHFDYEYYRKDLGAG